MNKTRRLPKLKPIDKSGKKYHYRLKDPFKKRKLAIDSGVYQEMRKRRITKKKAAQSKKARFNILRIYRRYKNPKDCKKITHDMKYMDKKYKLNSTKNICTSKKR